MKMVPASTRLADWLEHEIRGYWAKHGQGPGVGLRRIVEEWWTLQRFPALEFRDGMAGRRAGLRKGPDVWEIVMVARDYGADREGLAAHFGGHFPNEALDQALEYAEYFPDEIQEWIVENERVARLLASQSGKGR